MNACGYVANDGVAYPIIENIIRIFNINCVGILEHETDKNLLSFVEELGKKTQAQFGYELFASIIPKSEAVERRNTDDRRESRNEAIRKYFYGMAYGNEKDETKHVEDLFERKMNDLNSNVNGKGAIAPSFFGEGDIFNTFMKPSKHEFLAFERSIPFSDLRLYEIVSKNSSSFGGRGHRHRRERERERERESGSEVESDGSNVSLSSNRSRRGEKGRSGDMARRNDNFHVKSARLRENMVGTLIAVTYAQSSEEVLTSNVAGFLFLLSLHRFFSSVSHYFWDRREIDWAGKSAKFLSSSTGKLTGLCLLGGVKWFTPVDS